MREQFPAIWLDEGTDDGRIVYRPCGINTSSLMRWGACLCMFLGHVASSLSLDATGDWASGLGNRRPRRFAL